MHEVASRLYELLQRHGLNPVMVAGIIGALGILFYRRDLSNWSAIPKFRKSFIVIQLLTAVLLMVAGILGALGLVPF